MQNQPEITDYDLINPLLMELPSELKITADFQTKLNHVSTSNSIDDWAFKKYPSIIKETQFKTNTLDKIFASLWISDSQIVFGTKCNQLIVLDTKTGKKSIIPKITSNINIQSNNTIVESSDRILRSNLINQPQPISNNLVDAQDIQHRARSILHFNIHCSGIHSISSNPSKTLLAIGSGKPNDCIQIFKLPSFEPFAILLGHSDMVFSVVWVADDVLMSASRDKMIKFWKLDVLHQIHIQKQPNNVIVTTYKCMQTFEDRGKVRDLAIDSSTLKSATLSSDGYVKIWDSQAMKMTEFIPLNYTSELVCMAADQKSHLFSVGSQNVISIIDPRVGVVHNIDSLDEGWGVRSLLFKNNILLVGGGLGRVGFYDMRAQKYLDWDSNSNYIESGNGWIEKDNVYAQHFRDLDIKNAVYSISYDSDLSTGVFLGGGPLQLSLKGSYGGLWKI